MNKFKISANDFEMLVKYYNKKCKGSNLIVYQDSRQTVLKVDLSENSDLVTVEIYPEDLNTFPIVTKKVRLGEEL